MLRAGDAWMGKGASRFASMAGGGTVLRSTAALHVLDSPKRPLSLSISTIKTTLRGRLQPSTATSLPLLRRSASTRAAPAPAIVIATEIERAVLESQQSQPDGAIKINGELNQPAPAEHMPHTILIDGSFLTHRAYHTPIAEMTNGAGVAVTALFSYTRSMLKMLQDPHFRADYIGTSLGI